MAHCDPLQMNAKKLFNLIVISVIIAIEVIEVRSLNVNRASSLIGLPQPDISIARIPDSSNNSRGAPPGQRPGTTPRPTSSLPPNRGGSTTPSTRPGFSTSTVRPPNANVPTVTGNDVNQYCLESSGQFPGRFCNSFVNCFNGRANELFCPNNMLYNPRGFCDYGSNVDCNGKPIQDRQDDSNGYPIDGIYAPPPSPPPPPIGGPIPNPGGLYIPPPPLIPPPSNDPLIISQPLLPISPLPSYHNPTLPAPVTIEPSVILNPFGSPLIKYCLAPRGQFQGPNCNKFVNCWDGIAIEQFCPYGLHFNPHRGYCDFPYNFPCGGF